MPTIQDGNCPVYRLAMISQIWISEQKIKFAQNSSQGDSKVPNFIMASMGNPTYPIYTNVVEKALDYWGNIKGSTISPVQSCSRLENNKLSRSERHSLINTIAEQKAVIPYGHPQGPENARKIAARALNKLIFANYTIVNNNSKLATSSLEKNKSFLTKDDIVFVQGGVAAINFFIASLPSGHIMTPFPYYTVYKKDKPLHPILLSSKSHYRLSAAQIEDSFKKANELGRTISGIIICDPSNPLGTVINTSEASEIIKKLEDFFLSYQKGQKPFPQIFIDEAYAEMSGKRQSHLIRQLLESDKLSSYVSGIRLGTKSMSTAGARLGVFYTKNKQLLTRIVHLSIRTYCHVANPLPEIYANALDTITWEHLKNMHAFYKPQVKLVYKRLQMMGANLKNYQEPQVPFYVLADLSDLMHIPIIDQALPVLCKQRGSICCNDEDIAYNLLFKNNISIAPLSYFGWSYNKKYLAYFRITCSTGPESLHDLLNRIRTELHKARIDKITVLNNDIRKYLNDNSVFALYGEAYEKLLKCEYSFSFDSLDNEAKRLLAKKLNCNLEDVGTITIKKYLAKQFNCDEKEIANNDIKIFKEDFSVFYLKEVISNYEQLLKKIRNHQSKGQEKEIASTKIQSAFKIFKAKQTLSDLKEEEDSRRWGFLLENIEKYNDNQMPKLFKNALRAANTKAERNYYINSNKTVEVEYKKIAEAESWMRLKV